MLGSFRLSSYWSTDLSLGNFNRVEITREFFENLLLVFVPLFVAIDALGIVGLFLSFTERLDRPAKNRLVTEASLTALAISVVFLFFGRLIFRLLGIDENDFRVAGGILLLVLSIVDLLQSDHEQRRDPNTSVGIVPIGTPLIMGPAALTTILVAVETLGWRITLIALLMNLAIVWIVFRYADLVRNILGPGGTRAISKVMALFLAAIGVMMIRVGMFAILNR